MNNRAVDAVGIGNAIVDVLSHAETAFLEREGLPKGAMTLIDGARAEALYADMGPGVEVSGGSAANSMAGLAALGGRAAFIGKVRDDQLGGIFRHDIRAAGVTFDTSAAIDGASTARCFIFVTSDAQRTMGTFLGASVDLGPEDVDEDLIARAKVTYLEGYLWDKPRAKEAFLKAAEVAHGAGRKVALSLSDPFCVERHRAEFRDLVDGHVDLVFANEHEVCSLYEVTAFDDALQAVRGSCEVAALTRSEKGAVVLRDGEVHVVDAEPADKVVDTTGAGDLFAGGFLYGYTQGRGLYDCARIGAIAAAEVISHFGARPEVSLADLIAGQSA
ncbi:MAG: adenosine kinase [Rhodospirillales bacterium]|nr:adenosine kinase [Rhodospirillales bacterium]MDH3911002.1 adenosine kinase [Rhodospirillales bacterium]MDH3919571.1 adenosine kinase [Rhodospirillales bacterium]MDH3966131.1 adenosine kinase [Rhodospirillales bacterium]